MLQVVYGWKGIPSDFGRKWHCIHLPDETHENQYDFRDNGASYVGVVHEDVDVYEVVTTVDRNEVRLMTTKRGYRECRICGATTEVGI